MSRWRRTGDDGRDRPSLTRDAGGIEGEVEEETVVANTPLGWKGQEMDRGECAFCAASFDRSSESSSVSTLPHQHCNPQRSALVQTRRDTVEGADAVTPVLGCGGTAGGGERATPPRRADFLDRRQERATDQPRHRISAVRQRWTGKVQSWGASIAGTRAPRPVLWSRMETAGELGPRGADSVQNATAAQEERSAAVWEIEISMGVEGKTTPNRGSGSGWT